MRGVWHLLAVVPLGFLFSVQTSLAQESESASREIKAAREELKVFLGTAPVTVELPGTFAAAFFTQKAGVALKDLKQTVVLSPDATLPPQGTAVSILTSEKRVYSLRVLPPKEEKGDRRVFLRDENALPMFFRDITASAKEETIAVGANDPTVIAFPAGVSRVYKNNSSPLWLESAGSVLVVTSHLELPPFGDPMLVELENGRLYGLRCFPAGSKRPRDLSISFRDGSVIPVYGQELVYKPGTMIQTSINEPTAIMFPGMITSKFDSNDLVGLDVRKQGRRLVVIPYPTTVAPVSRLIVDVDNGQKYELKIVPAGKGNRRMWSVKLK